MVRVTLDVLNNSSERGGREREGGREGEGEGVAEGEGEGERERERERFM